MVVNSVGFLKLKLYGAGTIYINPAHISVVMDTTEFYSEEKELEGTCVVQIGADNEHPFIVEASAQEIVEVAAKIARCGTFLTGGF